MPKTAKGFAAMMTNMGMPGRVVHANGKQD